MILYLTSKTTNSFFILSTIILFFFCLYLVFKTKKLKEKITLLEIENKNILERKIMKNQNTDSTPIQNISHELKKETTAKQLPKSVRENKPVSTSKPKLEYVSKIPKQVSEERKIENYSAKKESPRVPTKEIPSEVPTQKKSSPSSNKPYQRNVLQQQNGTTSPVSISGKESFNMDQLSFDLNEFIKKSEKIVPKIEEQKTTPNYLKEVSAKMADELTPQTIELTDYEKEQEENAIISYQELLAAKDNLIILDDDDETVDFIEELKNFRDNLS